MLRGAGLRVAHTCFRRPEKAAEKTLKVLQPQMSTRFTPGLRSSTAAGCR